MAPRRGKSSVPKHVLGIMSGTSMDGVDFALCSVERNKIRLLQLESRTFPKSLRSAIRLAADNLSSSHDLAQVHHDLGRFYAHAAGSITWKFRPELAGLHGQTVFHIPSRSHPASLQIGEPAYLAASQGIPVISNFRAGDIAMGGQGAPLATLFHVEVFAKKGRHVCVNNLGGISNVISILSHSGSTPTVVAFDTGPGNVLLDLTVQRLTKGRRQMDRNGRLASKGVPNEAWLKRALRHPYFSAKPPKSTGREMFGLKFFEATIALPILRKCRVEDLLATFAEFTARTIGLNYSLHLGGVPDRVILCGGGARNEDLFRRIEFHLQKLNPSIEVATSMNLGWPVEAIESAAFALLAHRRWVGSPGNIPSTTGARRPALLGQITDLEVGI